MLKKEKEKTMEAKRDAVGFKSKTTRNENEAREPQSGGNVSHSSLEYGRSDESRRISQSLEAIYDNNGKQRDVSDQVSLSFFLDI